MSEIEPKTTKRYYVATALLMSSLGYAAGLTSAGVSEADAEEIEQTHQVSAFLDDQEGAELEAFAVEQWCAAVSGAFKGAECTVDDFRASPGVCQYYNQNPEYPDQWEIRVSVTKGRPAVWIE